uniref:Protein kinase domain-containing protein n=1 Tax=Amphimedon queenslandica TaxID=400682 RepID=A0A1X7USX4_AMPQE
EKDRELLQSQEAVRRYQQKALTDDHWVINKDEVTLTKEELGRGSYAVVIVGIFRGLRVAVKSLHTIIISDYNLALFSREMNIASRVRHPNLVQFIGATKLGNPLVLTELMSTSLNQELRRNRLTNQQILSIAQDVALGLNYLHLFKPQPIIHRDFWLCIKKPEAIDQWPVGRWCHAGAIIITRSDCPMLVISGGLDKNNDTSSGDFWIFNITQCSWIKLVVPHSVTKRLAHSLSVFIMSPHCVWIITAGGLVDKRRAFVTNPNIVMVTELVTNSKGEWTVGDTLDTNGMNNEEYKKKYQQQLQLGRKIWLEEYQKPRKGDTANIEQTVQALMKSFEEKEREGQVYHQQLEQKEREEAEKEQEIRRYCYQLQEKDREHQVVLQKLQENQEALRQKDIVILETDRELQEKDIVILEKDMELQVKDILILEKDRELQEKDRELQEKDTELQEKDTELLQFQEAVHWYQQQALTDDHWVINKDEVILTKEELGRGSYAAVTVGIFRGLRVAVKSLHNIIISDFNLALFSREMDIASRVRHPNLVQFIGATKVDNPLILTELMSTSLNQELHRNQLTNQQILSIAQDVALGLNYLHLFKPQAIIHRDISSPNVLLKPCTGPAGYEAKVSDYGTAKVVQAENTGTVMPGNVAYAAPEAPIPDQHSPAMDVYSYSVLLMEMNLCSRPEMTTAKRDVQSGSVSWSDMKSLIQRGLNANPRARPTMAQVRGVSKGGPGDWRTNEHSMYNLSSRKWSNPLIIGQCIPSASGFIIEKINNTRAVLFGGVEIDGDNKATITNKIYILEISISSVSWQCLKKPEAIDQWPMGRWAHAGSVIITGSDCPMLVISGGWNKNRDLLDDCWIFNVTQHSWIKLNVPHSVSKRWAHSLSVFIMSLHCVWIITDGGYVDLRRALVTDPNIVTLTELVTNSKGEWTVRDTLDTNGMNNEEYKKKYQQQLQLVRRIWLEEYQKPRKGNTADIEQTVQALLKSLEEKERERQVFHQQLEQKEREEAEKEQEIRRYRHQLQEKDREHQIVLQKKDLLIQQKDEEHQVVLQELQENREALQQKDIVILKKDKELQEKDKELQQSQEAVRRYQQKALTDDHWVINKDEVTLTKEELGRGSYAAVTVGIFRGLRVAVKSLHTIIISDYNLALFSREMNIASRIRHPNLVQFIGATKVGNPLVLTELMSTSLNQELHKNQITNQQILNIAQDVALGLNYLHLFKPQPIIHRDVSSPNVLLKPCSGPAGYEAKVADYGTAKVMQAENTGTIMPGNAAYAAPEAPIPDQHSPAMDVYSYSILLMEMNLCSLPEMTTAEREVQAGSVSWSDMKSLIQRGLYVNPKARPTMAQVIESLKGMKI